MIGNINFDSKHKSLFFKLTQLATLTQKNSGKPRLWSRFSLGCARFPENWTFFM